MTMQSDLAKLTFSKALGLFGQNTWALAKHYGLELIHDVSKVRFNAFILSSAIQVSSRIVISNNSARQAKGTVNESYRWLEAVKTLFREALGFVFSYSVLRSLQGTVIDFYRNKLSVTNPYRLPKGPGILNPLLRKIFKPAPVETGEKGFLGLKQTLKAFGKQVYGLLTRNTAQLQMPKLPEWHKVLFNDVPHINEIHFNHSKMGPRTKWLVNQVDALAQYLSKPLRESMGTFTEALTKNVSIKPADAAKLIMNRKMHTFLTWFPVLVASVPTLILSGVLLERFSQNKAEPLARQVAAWVKQHKNTPQIAAQQATLDPQQNVAYARSVNRLNTMDTPYHNAAYHTAYHPAFGQQANIAVWRGYGPFTPYRASIPSVWQPLSR